MNTVTGREAPSYDDGSNPATSTDSTQPDLDRSLAHIRLQAMRLRDGLASQVEEDGLVRDRCGSRVLESALLLSLLRKTSTLPHVHDGLADYLRNARPDGPMDTMIVEAAMGRPGQHDRAVAYLDEFRHHSGARKRLMLSTLLSLTGVMPIGTNTDAHALHYQGYAAWTELSLCAIKILHGHAHGGHAAVSSADRDYLAGRLESAGPGQVWEGNALAHLIALHALHACQPDSPLLHGGIAALCRIRNSDGGLPFISGQEIFVTALAGKALAAARAPRSLLIQMADRISGLQQRDGGWGYTETTAQTDVDDTAVCVEFLRIADTARYRQVVARAEQYLGGMADPRGGFSTYVRGHQREVDMTAGAVMALSASWQDHAPLVDKCVDFLLCAQRDDGTFENSWTRSRSSAIHRVLDALRHIPPALADRSARIAHATSASTGYLARTQNPDGGWGYHPGKDSDVVSTAHALPVIAHTGHRHTLRRGLHYLLTHQNADGGYTSVPDQVGPRPLPFDYPVLADVHVLNAFTQLHHAPPTATTAPKQPAPTRPTGAAEEPAP
ncbi:prenyltransferase/squalene oxidase repeat-containing protein [Streptomyces sp. AC550_RSS872]|uniref:prenyltransferase/squalene oxidase repeat-containing protein n=1 Tax=Streptomyces sp. AC550_RSS872 TaxID=2823689 RepID=UPI001C26D771|nr:prenyltransferase/squalene oxidase repeat-containing protein [Streptomyces sp. AC550_RSS872]